MPVTDRHKLRKFLGKSDRQYNLMAELEPFFKNAQAGNYPLAPASAELAREALAVLQSVFGQKAVIKVIFISLSKPFPQPDWMTKEGYKAALSAHLLDNMWESLKHGLKISLSNYLIRTRFNNRDKISCGDNLVDSLWDNLIDSLWGNLWESIRNSLWDKFCPNIEDVLEDVIFYFLSSALANNTKEVEKLRPLVRLLPKTVPLGVKKGEPGTWLLLAA